MHLVTFPPLARTLTLIPTRTLPLARARARTRTRPSPPPSPPLTRTGPSPSPSPSPAPSPSPRDQAASSLFDLPVDQWQTSSPRKSLQHTGAAADAPAPAGAPPSATPPKLLVMATACEAIARVHSATPDAAVPSFAAEHGGRKAKVPTSRGARRERSSQGG